MIGSGGIGVDESTHSIGRSSCQFNEIGGLLGVMM